MSLRDVLTSIAIECDRQNLLKLEGRFPHHTGDDELSDAQRYLVLAEEVGEVARAILERSGLSNDRHGVNLRKELVQVAAVAAKWIEGMDRRACEDFERLPGVVCYGLGSRGSAPALDREGVDEGRDEGSENTAHDPEARALGLAQGDENDDADQRREGEDRDDENAEQVG